MASVVSSGAEVDNKSVTWTGWFSDSQCATARAKSGVFTPTNPDCAKKCMENGSAVVFISAPAQALYTILAMGTVLRVKRIDFFGGSRTAINSGCHSLIHPASGGSVKSGTFL